MRKLNIDVRTGDMRIFLYEDLGRFDVVTAFCSLYYLPEEDMARVIRRAASMGATLILQANEAIHNLPASASRLAHLMGGNGYPNVRVAERAGCASATGRCPRVQRRALLNRGTRRLRAQILRRFGKVHERHLRLFQFTRVTALAACAPVRA